jgi:hypothetical protein
MDGELVGLVTALQKDWAFVFRIRQGVVPYNQKARQTQGLVINYFEIIKQINSTTRRCTVCWG